MQAPQVMQRHDLPILDFNFALLMVDLAAFEQVI